MKVSFPYCFWRCSHRRGLITYFSTFCGFLHSIRISDKGEFFKPAKSMTSGCRGLRWFYTKQKKTPKNKKSKYMYLELITRFEKNWMYEPQGFCEECTWQCLIIQFPCLLVRTSPKPVVTIVILIKRSPKKIFECRCHEISTRVKQGCHKPEEIKSPENSLTFP